MPQPEISVVIPAYNAEKTLEKCLRSVQAQSYENYEVIVVDNGSSDGTRKIIESIGEKDKRIQYIFEPQRGRGIARNRGIEKVCGEIIAMTDADCIVPPFWLEELTKPIRHENENAVMGFEEDLVGNYWTKNIQKANREFLRDSQRGEYVTDIDTKNFAIKASLMKETMFDPVIKTLEDAELAVRLREVLKVRFLPLLVVGHMHKNSFWGVVKLNIDRSYWVVKIFQKHKKCPYAMDTVMMRNFSFRNFILFPFWMFCQFVKRPIGEAFFVLVSEVSWGMGIVWALVRKSSRTVSPLEDKERSFIYVRDRNERTFGW